MKIGDRVKKIKGYKFVGTVVAVFVTTEGQHRLVVQQDEAENGGGLLHIFNPDQLELI